LRVEEVCLLARRPHARLGELVDHRVGEALGDLLRRLRALVLVRDHERLAVAPAEADVVAHLVDRFEHSLRLDRPRVEAVLLDHLLEARAGGEPLLELRRELPGALAGGLLVLALARLDRRLEEDDALRAIDELYTRRYEERDRAAGDEEQQTHLPVAERAPQKG